MPAHKAYVWGGSGWNEFTVDPQPANIALREIEISSTTGFSLNTNITVTRGTGTNTSTAAFIPQDTEQIEVLLVGGGGGGGLGGGRSTTWGGGGGGGAGGVIYNLFDISSVSSFTVLVGSGGAGGSASGTAYPGTATGTGATGNASTITIGAAVTTAGGGGGGGPAGTAGTVSGSYAGSTGASSGGYSGSGVDKAGMLMSGGGGTKGYFAGGGGGAGGQGGVNASVSSATVTTGGTFTSSNGAGNVGHPIAVGQSTTNDGVPGLGGKGVIIMGRMVAGGGHGGQVNDTGDNNTAGFGSTDALPAQYGVPTQSILTPKNVTRANSAAATGAGGIGGAAYNVNSTFTMVPGSSGGSGICVIRYLSRS